MRLKPSEVADSCYRGKDLKVLLKFYNYLRSKNLFFANCCALCLPQNQRRNMYKKLNEIN